MNFLRKTVLKVSSRYLEPFIGKTYSSHNKTSLVAERLTERSLIRVQGNDVVPYLQGLITNDMGHFQRGARSMYAMFLNNTGRVMYDTIIYRTGDEDVYLVECDKSACNELRRHLRLYRVRRNVEVDSISSEYLPWVVFNFGLEKEQLDELQEVEDLFLGEKSDVVEISSTALDFNVDEVVACHDPRMKTLGIRVIMPMPFSYQEISKLFANYNVIEPTSKNNYKSLRYSLGVGEGIQDHPPNKCFPLEANCDFLHGVSFHKGCYIGQELTARVHHTGVIRKRLMPIKLTKKIDAGVINVQSVGGSIVGTLRGATNNFALALLRVEQVLKNPNLVIDGDPCSLIIPDWWPKELPSKYVLKEKIIENS